MAQSAEVPLRGRVALVTGASRGIGSAIAQRLGSAGATVVLSARSLQRSADGLAGTLEETKSLIEKNGGRAIALACDVENLGSRQNLIDETLRHAGRLDILVNNAGRAVHQKLEAFTPQQALSQTEQYLLGPLDLARLAADHMRQQGEGWIVNVGSSTAEMPAPGPPWDDYTAHGGAALYAALKAAVHRLSVNLAAELYAENIAVNVVAPVGAILTPGVEALGVITEATKAYLEPVEHIAEAALALVAGNPKTLTGKIAYSYRFLDDIGRPTRSLDGKNVIQDRRSAVR